MDDKSVTKPFVMQLWKIYEYPLVKIHKPKAPCWNISRAAKLGMYSVSFIRFKELLQRKKKKNGKNVVSKNSENQILILPSEM